MDRSYRAPLLLFPFRRRPTGQKRGPAVQKNEHLVLYMCVCMYVCIYICICVYLCMYVFLYISLFFIHSSYTYISFCILVCIHLVCIFVFISSPSSHIHLTHNAYTTQFLTHYFGFGFTHTRELYILVCLSYTSHTHTFHFAC